MTALITLVATGVDQSPGLNILNSMPDSKEVFNDDGLIMHGKRVCRITLEEILHEEKARPLVKNLKSIIKSLLNPYHKVRDNLIRENNTFREQSKGF